MKHNKTTKSLRKKFITRLENLAFKRTEYEILFGVGKRIIQYYISGERNIPTAKWVRLEELEKTPREELCRIIVKSKKKKY